MELGFPRRTAYLGLGQCLLPFTYSTSLKKMKYLLIWIDQYVHSRKNSRDAKGFKVNTRCLLSSGPPFPSSDATTVKRLLSVLQGIVYVLIYTCKHFCTLLI